MLDLMGEIKFICTDKILGPLFLSCSSYWIIVIFDTHMEVNHVNTQW